MNTRIRFSLYRSDRYDDRILSLIKYEYDHDLQSYKKQLAQVEWIPMQEGTPALPILRIGDDQEDSLQSLMDAMWREGIRPTDIGTPGHLAATQQHLLDMRAIAFSKLKVPIPGK